jgi:RNA polymerase sigma factor (TIGR02999 family)
LAQPADSAWKNRAHFFAAAAQVMRRVLVDHARSRNSNKRWGNEKRIALDEVQVYFPQRSSELLALDEALVRLSKLDPRQARIVELRFFAGLSEEEVAEVLDVSSRTVKRDWTTARAWLYQQVLHSGPQTN